MTENPNIYQPSEFQEPFSSTVREILEQWRSLIEANKHSNRIVISIEEDESIDS